MVLCNGCGGEFSFGRGYLNHLRLSRNPACSAIYQQSIAPQMTSNDVDSDDDLEMGSLGPDSLWNDFGGDNEDMDIQWSDQDLFVAVEQAKEKEDMGGWEDGMIDLDGVEAVEDSGHMDHNSDSEDDFDEGPYLGWEPPVPPSFDDENFNTQQDLEAEDGLEASQAARLAAEDAFRKQPIIEKFPDDRAGAPIANKRMDSKNESYFKAINNSQNPWAPFLSKMDWEVARWAKLRGPGSTAMSDLLKIEGVSIIF